MGGSQVGMNDGGMEFEAGPDVDETESGKPTWDQPTPIDDDEIEIIGDLGSEFDDPEGWMSERPTYWADLAQEMADSLARERGGAPTRASYLCHRIKELIGELVSIRRGPAPAWTGNRADEAAWSKAADRAFGPGLQGQDDDGRLP